MGSLTCAQIWVRVVTYNTKGDQIDRNLMFYAQSTAKGHIREKQNVFLPQVNFFMIHYLLIQITHPTVEVALI